MKKFIGGSALAAVLLLLGTSSAHAQATPLYYQGALGQWGYSYIPVSTTNPLPITVVSGVLSVAHGGTGLSSLGTAGQCLQVNGGGTALTYGSCSGASIVNSFSAGTTGFTPSSPTTGAVVLGGTLGVANGGTGTGTAFTTGSVVFAGASGVYSQDNTNFFWDNTSKVISIGGAIDTGLFPGAVASFSSAAPAGGYTQAIVQDTTASGQGCWIARSDDGTDTNHYGQLCMNNSVAPNVSNVYFTTPHAMAVYNTDPELDIATGVVTDANGIINFYVDNNSSPAMSVIRNNVGIGTTMPATALSVVGIATVSTNVATPLVIGGSAAGSSLSLQSTSGVGTTDFIKFLVGNNGGTEAMRIIDSGSVGIGTTSVATGKLEVVQSTDTSAGGIGIRNTAETASMRLWVDAGGAPHMDGNSSGNAALVINQGGGNVGIGANTAVAKLDLSPGTTNSAAAWGTTGPGLNVRAGTFNDSSSSGTVAGPTTLYSIQNGTLTATSSTTYTNSSVLYLGTVAGGSNATITNAYSLWAAGPIFGASGIQATNFVVTSSNIPANGIYRPATNTLGFATNSIEVAAMGTASSSFFLPVAIGTSAAPAAGTVLDLSNSANASLSLAVPVGTTGQRPASPINGMIRYNSTTAAMESYTNSTWGPEVNYPLDSGAGQSTAVGISALANQTAAGSAAYQNTAIGYQAIGTGTMTTAGIQNVAIGYTALAALTTGNGNTAIGRAADSGITTGSSNVFIGLNAGRNNTTGSFETIIGQGSATGVAAAALGNSNVIIGEASATSTTFTGANNTLVGTVTGVALTSGASNTILGNAVANTTLATGSNNILIGVSSAVTTAAAGTSNTIGIGGTGGVEFGATGTNTASTVAFFDTGTLSIGTSSAASTGTVLDLSNSANASLALALPVGTTGQRPTGINGMLRYNSTTTYIEGFINSVWTALANLNTVNTFTATQSVAPSTVAISTSTFTPVANASNTYQITLVHASCPCTIANPSGTMVAGTDFVIEVKQSSTGSDTVSSWGSQYKFSGGTAPTLSTGANITDMVACHVSDSTHAFCGFNSNFAQ